MSSFVPARRPVVPCRRTAARPFNSQWNASGSAFLLALLLATAAPATRAAGAPSYTELLQQSLQSGQEIANYQQAVRTLSGQPDGRHLLTAHGLLTGEKEGNLYGLVNWLSAGPRLYRQKWLRIAIILMWTTCPCRVIPPAASDFVTY